MYTPRKLLLSPKFLSPRSPAGYNQIGNELKVPQARNQNSSRSSVAKKLEFLSPNTQFIQKESPISKIQFCITDTSVCERQRCKLSLDVNTPKKSEILEHGLENLELNILGRGAFGTVVKGIYKGKNAAVKVMKLREHQTRLSESLVLDFDHPNVIRTIEVIRNDSKQYAIVVMECLENFVQLQSIINNKNNDLPNEIVIRYCKDLSSAVAYCHKRNVLHLDIKPQNILVNQNGVCKLCDFGNCFSLDEDTPENYQYQGTVAYAAPELLSGKAPTKKCDIYSFGVVLWQMLHRKNPYEDIDHYELIVYKVVKFGLRPQCSDDLHDLHPLFTRCWSTKPDNRPTAEEILKWLNEY